MRKTVKTPTDILNLFLRLQTIDEDSGDVITNLKAQKLLYYTQGMSMVKLGRPMFNDDFVAWQHGPVIINVYEKLKQFGSNQIEIKEPLDIDSFSEKELGVIISVYKTFGQFSAWKLRDMTHEEDPWKNVNINETITKESIRAFFSKKYARI